MSHEMTRRLFIKGMAAVCLLSVSRIGFSATKQVVAVRLWPSSTYTRVTIESNQPLEYNSFSLESPKRLVIDISKLNINQTIRSLSTLVNTNDPYIKNIRVAQFKPDVVRIVLELKQSVDPDLFTLKPYAEFQHRLVVDLYPQHADVSGDPLLALLEMYNKGDLEKNDATTSITPPKTSTEIKPRPKKGPFIVVLDPGHGGEDPGAIGYRKTQEKHVVLQIARRLRAHLQKEKDIRVYMTRDEDVFIPLKVRVAKARQLKADIFISIHADAFLKRTAKGSSIFALSLKGATSTAASYLAKTQNEADFIGGVSRSGDRYLDRTIFDLLQTATVNDSLKLGAIILSHMKQVNHLHKSTVDQAGFAVLKAPDIPSVLVETAFLSNLEEEKKLRTSAFQEKVAKAILAGINDYRRFKKM